MSLLSAGGAEAAGIGVVAAADCVDWGVELDACGVVDALCSTMMLYSQNLTIVIDGLPYLVQCIKPNNGILIFSQVFHS